MITIEIIYRGETWKIRTPRNNEWIVREYFELLKEIERNESASSTEKESQPREWPPLLKVESCRFSQD